MLLETNSLYFSLLTTTMLGNYQFVVKFQVMWRSLKNVSHSSINNQNVKIHVEPSSQNTKYQRFFYLKYTLFLSLDYSKW